jgi:hypothetical protein
MRATTQMKSMVIASVVAILASIQTKFGFQLKIGNVWNVGLGAI